MNFLSVSVSKISKTIFLTLILYVAFTPGICRAIEAPDCLKDSKPNTTVNKGNIDINPKDDFKEFLVPESVSSESPTVEKKVSVNSFNDDINTPKENYDLAKMYEKTNNSELALKYYQKAIKLDPEYDAAYSGLARTQEKLGQTASAGSTYLKLANLYQTFNMIEQAKQCKEKALKLNPESETLQLAVKTAMGDDLVKGSNEPNSKRDFATARSDRDLLNGFWINKDDKNLTKKISGNDIFIKTSGITEDYVKIKGEAHWNFRLDDKAKLLYLFNGSITVWENGKMTRKTKEPDGPLWNYHFDDANNLTLDSSNYFRK